jgi:ABC-type branched-subunit amino acid transport system permease subunit
MSTVATSKSADVADTVLFTPAPKRNFSTLLVNLGVVLLVSALAIGVTFNWKPFNQLEFSKVVAFIAVAAGLTVLTGLNGQLSLGHGALMAVSAYTVALVQPKLADNAGLYGWRILISIAVGILATAVVGLVIGVIAARLRGPYLAGATLTLALVVPAIGSMVKPFKGDQGLPVRIDSRPQGLIDAFGTTFTANQWKAWIAVGVTIPAIVLLANLVRSRYGRSFKAVRDDEVAASLSGINVARTQVIAFVVSAVCAGVSGALFGVVYGQANPGLFSLNLSLYLLLAIVLGGLGSIWGAVWGSIILVVLPDTINTYAQNFTNGDSAALNRLNGSLPLAVFGVALVVVILVVPGGLQGLIRRIAQWLGSIRRPASQ